MYIFIHLKKPNPDHKSTVCNIPVLANQAIKSFTIPPNIGIEICFGEAIMNFNSGIQICLIYNKIEY